MGVGKPPSTGGTNRPHLKNGSGAATSSPPPISAFRPRRETSGEPEMGEVTADRRKQRVPHSGVGEHPVVPTHSVPNST